MGDLHLEPQEGMQTKFIEYDEVYEMFTGGMAGPGKSWILLFAEIESIIRWPHLRTLVLRRKTPELAELVQEAHGMYVNPTLQGKFYGQHSLYKRAAFVFPKFHFDEDEEGNITDFYAIPGTQGAIVVFGHMIKENTKFEYGGFQFPHIRWDEVCNFTESQYTFMFSRNRSKEFPDNPAMYIPPNIRSTSNPIGIGKHWVKRRFIDPMDPEVPTWFKKIEGKDTVVSSDTHRARSRIFIPGNREENQYIGDDYEANLEQMSDGDQRALREGLWDDFDSPNQLIRSEWINRAELGDTIEPVDPSLKGQHAMGVDAAYEGDDQSVLVVGRENTPQKIWGYAQTAGQDLAWLIDEECKMWPDMRAIGIDSNGIGVSCCDFLESGGENIPLKMPGLKGLKVKITSRSSQVVRCSTKDPRWDEKYLGTYKFPNFRSQAYWKLRVDMENNRIDLSKLRDNALNEKNAGRNGNSHGDFYEMLMEELRFIKYEIKGGLIIIQSKDIIRKEENLGRSTDCLDALVYWNWVRENEVQANAPHEMDVHPDTYLQSKSEKSYQSKKGDIYDPLI